MQLAEMAERFDKLVQGDPSAFADPESIVALHRFRARFDAFVTKATAAFDASGIWAEDGAQSAAACIATRTGIPKTAARREVRLGRALRELTATDEAWLAGELTEAQVGAISRLGNAVTAEALARDEEALVGHAKRLRAEEFFNLCAYWRQLADPDGTESMAEAQRRDRDVYLAASFEGMFFGKMTLDPISGAIVSGELERLREQLFQDEWAAEKQRLGTDPVLADLPRSHPQRMADALVEMARRSAAKPQDAREPVVLINVLVDFPTFTRTCELAQGIVVSPGSVVPLLSDAVIERMVFAPPNRVDVGERTRLFLGATRRGIVVRDRKCQHPFCDRQAEYCQVDHIVPYSEGGLTTQENGRLLCAFHNRHEYRNLLKERRQRPPPDAA